jgi:hypothetical protein
MKLKAICECKNIEPAGEFICTIEPNEKGRYTWLLEKEGKTFGGIAHSQKEAINQAFAPTVDELLTHLENKTGVKL